MKFFAKGSIWKHRNLGFIVNITEVVDAGYLLGWANPDDYDRGGYNALAGVFTAENLVRDFVPVIEASKWDALLDGDSPLAEDKI